MTIARTADRITEHPYFLEACMACSRGDIEDMRIMLIDLMAHVAMVQNGLDARTHNLRRRETYPDINRAIREKACSCELNFQLPIVIPGCLVVNMNEDSERVAL